MARPATGHDRDLAGDRRRGPNERAWIVGDPVLLGIRGQNPLEHVVDQPSRIVDELLHFEPFDAGVRQLRDPMW